MALQMDFSLAGGIVATNSYIRICKIMIDIDRQYVQMYLKIYKDKATRDNGGDPIVEKTESANATGFSSFLTAADVSPLNNNHVSQAYLYLKTLADYANAVDA